jgi:hypothetical protein
MRKTIFLVILPLFLIGCATTVPSYKFSQLQMGMSKQEVRQILGNPYLFRSAINNQETWEYLVYAPHLEPWTGKAQFWVNFIDNKLTFYGRPGDYNSSIPETTRQEIIRKER